VLVPTVEASLGQVARLTVGPVAICGIPADGSLRCNGRFADLSHGAPDGYAQGTHPWSNAAAPVAGLTGVAQVALATNAACVLVTGGTVHCWGMSEGGALGDGRHDEVHHPTRLRGVADGVELVTGNDFACVRRRAGEVRCWGAMGSSWMDGVPRYGTTPGTVPGLASVVQLAAGEGFACALQADGTVACWGLGGDGQLGDGTTGDQISPVRVRLRGP
jgi:alpha-tubulin suppressor-like RCC1 family protein